MTTNDRDGPIPIEQLTESYRFDEEFAALLTTFQYHNDGICLTAAEARPLPASAYTAATAGLEAVFEADASLVFVCYDDRCHQMVNPIEATLTHAIANAVTTAPTPHPDGGTAGPLAEAPSTDPAADTPLNKQASEERRHAPRFGVVTPHNAQRGGLDAAFPTDVTTNTVEKYQGNERDIIAVSATVSDPEFARHEERFILNPRRLLVAISRSRLLTVVVCSTALFGVAPQDNDRLDDGPVWARLFTDAVGRTATPAWAGPLAEFTDTEATAHASVPVQVYPSTVSGSQ